MAAGLMLLAACEAGATSDEAAVESAVTDSSVTVTTTRAAPSATARPPPAPTATAASDRLLSSESLRAAVNAAEIRMGLEDLQAIAAEHGGNRAVGTSGYDASVRYVAARLVAAGYAVERQPFSFSDGGVSFASVNLIAERSTGAANETTGAEDEVVLVGAHLDSVPFRAGINDNGSGSMTLLTVAEKLVEFEATDRTIRFAFWGAEEPGLYGSSAYVSSLDTAARGHIAAYLNFDMVGSPNHVRFIYADAGAPPGSEALTQLFASYFDSVGLAWDTFDLTRKADHAAFSEAGIPTGGLFSGGGEVVTDAQAAGTGGTAGIPADACNDSGCDTTANISDRALDEMADAAAHAIVTLASD